MQAWWPISLTSNEVARAFGITHILISPGDYETEFEPQDRVQILHLLFDDPTHKTIYSADGFTVLEIEPAGISAGFERFTSRP